MPPHDGLFPFFAIVAWKRSSSLKIQSGFGTNYVTTIIRKQMADDFGSKFPKPPAHYQHERNRSSSRNMLLYCLTKEIRIRRKIHDLDQAAMLTEVCSGVFYVGQNKEEQGASAGVVTLV